MLDRSGAVKVTDFGLAKVVQPDAPAGGAAPKGRLLGGSKLEVGITNEGAIMGTPRYMAPEQLEGSHRVDHRADIYSLGATMYHMVTGQVPFDGANPSTVMHKHLKNALVPPAHLNKSLSSGISEVIEVCMAKDRTKRYASAADLLEVEGVDDALASHLASHGIVTRDDLAEQATDDLLEIIDTDEATAGELIMAARAHWFAEGEQS